jgi:ribonuclease HI
VSLTRPWQVIVDYFNIYKLSMEVEEQSRQQQEKQWINVNWLAPSPGWIVLNSDGAAKLSDRKAGCGGVLRNDKGYWIEGFAKALGDTTSYMVELWGIYEGLNLAQHRGVTRLELRTDSQVIAKSLKDDTSGSIMGCALMKRIKNLLHGSWKIRILHVFREANRCADMLANMGSEGLSGIEFFASRSPRVMQIVEDDVRGVSFPRLISV